MPLTSTLKLELTEGKGNWVDVIESSRSHGNGRSLCTGMVLVVSGSSGQSCDNGGGGGGGRAEFTGAWSWLLRKLMNGVW